MKHTGPAPFGFAWKGSTLSVVETEAQIRKLAFELYAELESKSAVAKRLNSAGHTTRRGSKWSDVAVGRLLVCPSARGLYAGNKITTDELGERTDRPADKGGFVECQRLVSEELWDRVQTALAKTELTARVTNASSHPFTGILFCQCGARMNVASSAPKFACGECEGRIPISDLEARFLDEVTSFLQSRKDTASDFLVGDQALAEQRNALREAHEKIQSLDEKISKAERLVMDKQISVDRFAKIHRSLEEERRALQRELGKVKAKLSRLEAQREADEPQAPFAPGTLRKRWPTISPKAQRDIVRGFLSRINVGRDEIEFTYRFREISGRTAKTRHFPGPTCSATQGDAGADEPDYIRLPKPGQRCPRTGMTRSALNQLILPNARNNYQPPVESRSLRKREDGKGTRLIVWQSLKAYLYAQN